MSELEKAIQLRKDGKISEAIEIHRDLMRKKRYKTESVVLAEHGISYYLARYLEEGDKYLRKSIEYGNDPLADAYLALIESEKDNLEDAERYIERSLRFGEERDSERLFIHGLIKSRLGKYKEAIRSLRESLLVNYGEVRTSKVRSIGQKLGHILRKNPPDWLKLGLLFEGFNRLEEARHLYRLATRVNPENPDTWVFLADILENQGEFDEVVCEGRKYAPDNIELRCLDAESFYDAGMQYEALRMFEEIPGETSERWVERITEEFDKMLEHGDYNPWLGEYGAIIRDDFYHDDY